MEVAPYRLSFHPAYVIPPHPPKNPRSDATGGRASRWGRRGNGRTGWVGRLAGMLVGSGWEGVGFRTELSDSYFIIAEF